MKRTTALIVLAALVLLIAALRVDGECYTSCIAETCFQKKVNGLVWNMLVQNNETCLKDYWDTVDQGTSCSGAQDRAIRRMQTASPNCSTWPATLYTPRRATYCLYFHQDTMEYTISCCESCTFD